MTHIAMLGVSAIVINGGFRMRGLPETYIATGVTIVALYPICIGYRALKRKHPKSALRYL